MSYAPNYTGVTSLFVGVSTDTKPEDANVGSILKETDTGNEYIWNGTAWQEYRMRYKDLGLVIDATNVAAGASIQSAWFDKLQWARYTTIMYASDQAVDLQMQRRDSSLQFDSNIQLVASLASTSGVFGTRIFSQANNNSVETNLSYGVRFGIKNVSASPATALKLKVQLLGE